MEALKQTSLLLLYVAAAGFIYYFLLPSGRLSQTAKSVFAAFMLLCVLQPLFGLLRNPVSAVSAVPAAFDAADYGAPYTAAAERTVKRQIREIVERYTDEAYEIYVSAHITPSLVIDIEQVRLRFRAAPPEWETLRRELTAALGSAPELEVQEDE